MTRIGLLSDTHSYMDNNILQQLKNCDAIWHAGDFGNQEVIRQLQALDKPLQGVYGNIDGQEIRALFPKVNTFICESVKVTMKHIGGYPPRYNKETLPIILAEKPKIFISGHSHILKIMYDEKLQCLHLNPGAAGKQGWHKVRTLIRFTIDGTDIKDCEVVEM